jgi:hypothetical protein
MIQHRPEGIYNVDNVGSLDSRMSLEPPNAMSTEFLRQQILTIAHVDVSMNLNRRKQMSNN